MRHAANVCAGIAALTMLPWLGLAPFSLMLLDGGPSRAAYAFVTAMFLYPFWLVISLVRSRRALQANEARTAVWLAIVGMAPFAGMLAVAALYARS